MATKQKTKKTKAKKMLDSIVVLFKYMHPLEKDFKIDSNNDIEDVELKYEEVYIAIEYVLCNKTKNFVWKSVFNNTYNSVFKSKNEAILELAIDGVLAYYVDDAKGLPPTFSRSQIRKLEKLK